MAKPEKFVVENKSLQDIIMKDLLKDFNKNEGQKIFPTTIVLIKESEKDGKKQVCPIILSHQNSKEVQDRVLHVECPDVDFLEEFVNVLENKVKK